MHRARRKQPAAAQGKALKTGPISDFPHYSASLGLAAIFPLFSANASFRSRMWGKPYRNPADSSTEIPENIPAAKPIERLPGIGKGKSLTRMGASEAAFLDELAERQDRQRVGTEAANRRLEARA